MRVGVEVGGTFTDLVAIEGERVIVTKVPSVPSRPDDGAMDALAEAGLDLATVDDLVHGSTVATNAILERKGARVAFLVTEGFRDILLLQRHLRERIYDLFYKKPQPVVPRSDTLEIAERIDGKGNVVEALDEDAAMAAVARLLEGGDFGSVAICFLNAYANPTHEQALARRIAERWPDLPVTCSSTVSGEFREYERASTTTLAAYVQPVIDRYLKRFDARLGEGGFKGRFSVMQSNGGRLPAAGMAENAITSLFSGPAAGVMGAVRQAVLSGHPNLITLDMGGTSTDVCLVADGKPQLAGETSVGGLPIRTPVLDIVTVGAGGGSLCWVDDGGMLRVGPESAGADPGPACYGRGGTEPAITDAHLVRGTIRPDAFLGGRMSIDQAAAEQALAPLAERFEMSVAELADSAVRVADANIVRAIQLVSTERGRDPRDYVLVPFGGAGPLHAARVADELGISTVLVPPNAGVLSAYGLLASDFVRYETQTRRIGLKEGAAADIKTVFAELKQQAVARFAELGLKEIPQFTYTLEMRFVGQAFEIPVELSEMELEVLSEAALLDRFNEAHSRVFSFGESGLHRAEVVSFRLGASVPPDAVPSLNEGSSFSVTQAEVEIFDAGQARSCTVIGRPALRAGEARSGPLLIEDETATVFVPHGWRARLDTRDNIVMEKEA